MSTVPPLSSSSSGRSEISLDGIDSLDQPTHPVSPRIAESNSGSLPPLQIAHGEPGGLDPIAPDGLESDSYDLVKPSNTPETVVGKHKLEQRSELLFSIRHLQAIFDNPGHLHHFTSYLFKYRPASIGLLKYYLEALKALRAIQYSNEILTKLSPFPALEFIHKPLPTAPTANASLCERIEAAFEALAREDLPMYITHVWIQTVSASISLRIMGTPPRHLYEGLAEVFCLTDPSRPDNPIVFMSEEFNRTTQYGVDYIIGRNCRFLQGPCTNPFSVQRIRERLAAGIEHYETFLNYRRDGSPFMNLVMLAPLYDSRGTIRYFLGAQIDVSGLAMDCYGLPALKQMVTDENKPEPDNLPTSNNVEDKFMQLAEILGPRELEIVRDHGGDMYRHVRLQVDHDTNGDDRTASTNTRANSRQDESKNTYTSPKANKRVLLQDADSPIQTPNPYESIPIGPATEDLPSSISHNGRLAGVYTHYLLVRPYPSLRILFTSPSMRIPGILQSPLLDRISGSSLMRDKLVQALASGQAVTAKVRWLNYKAPSTSNDNADWDSSRNSTPTHQHHQHPETNSQRTGDTSSTDSVGKSRWLHCTPLTGNNGKVGVWMIVMVDDALEHHDKQPRRPPKVAPESVIDQHPQPFNYETTAATGGGHLQRPSSTHSEAFTFRMTDNNGTDNIDQPVPLPNGVFGEFEETPDPALRKPRTGISTFSSPPQSFRNLGVSVPASFFHRDGPPRIPPPKLPPPSSPIPEIPNTAKPPSSSHMRDITGKIKQMRIDARNKRGAFRVPRIIPIAPLRKKEVQPEKEDEERCTEAEANDATSLFTVKITSN